MVYNNNNLGVENECSQYQGILKESVVFIELQVWDVSISKKIPTQNPLERAVAEWFWGLDWKSCH